jgi:hypothetical protein
MSFAADHGIASDALESHPFAGTRWSYTVDPSLETPQLRITEFMAENLTTYRDEDQDPEDWIEIFNPTATAVNLEGWSLSNDDDDPGLWVFPSVRLPPGGHLVVLRFGQGPTCPTRTARLHTNFKLNPNGGYLGLFGPGTATPGPSAKSLPEQGPNHAYARENNTGEWRYFVAGSPGTATAPARSGRWSKTSCSACPAASSREPFDSRLSCPTPGASIRYTTNGSPPTPVDGFLYTNPIPFSVTRVIRAAAFLDQALPSRVGTHTYLLNPTGTRLRVPALSLVTATNNLYGRNGIMEVSPRNTTKRGAAWERPVSVEWIRPEDNDGFQVDCGLRIQGGDYVRGQYNYRSTELPFSKYSFRLYFRGEYGQGRLELSAVPRDHPDLLRHRRPARRHERRVQPVPHRRIRPFPRARHRPTLARRHLRAPLPQRRLQGLLQPLRTHRRRFPPRLPRRRREMGRHGPGRRSPRRRRHRLQHPAHPRQYPPTSPNPTNYRDVAPPRSHQLRRLPAAPHLRRQRRLAAQQLARRPGTDRRSALSHVLLGRRMGLRLVNGHAPTWDTIRNQLSSTSPPWGGADIQRIFIGLKKAPEFRQFFADRAHRHFFNGGALTDDRIRAGTPGSPTA